MMTRNAFPVPFEIMTTQIQDKPSAQTGRSVVVASPRGFCAGVDLAIGIVELAIKRYGPPVYVKHQIVHNPQVVADVEGIGAVTVEQVDEVPEGAVVVFSAHGSPPSDYEIAKQRNLTVLDATCPLVTKVHHEAKKYTSEGKRVILVGHRGHQEVIGTTGQADMELYDEREDNDLPEWEDNTGVVVLTQTTLSVADTAQAVDKIQSKFNNTLIRNDICYATTNRQAAATDLAQECDIVLVIGAENSSNCNRLREVVIKKGVEAYLINGPNELNPEWLVGKKRVGVTSGASTPEKMVRAVIDAIEHEELVNIGSGEEGISFKLPAKLRETAKEAGYTYDGSMLE
jgi:4-hydroxy-3-methylbut-2-enyl diphosphate reductase